MYHVCRVLLLVGLCSHHTLTHSLIHSEKKTYYVRSCNAGNGERLFLDVATPLTHSLALSHTSSLYCFVACNVVPEPLIIFLFGVSSIHTPFSSWTLHGPFIHPFTHSFALSFHPSIPCSHLFAHLLTD
ncbi:hypothetical protein BGZ63DRAFT_380867 [Mariannaea sp. PMI_226]|nr:hypothetical protein BGZ63DRAFT_380867 [Mariannaea sp. PMI_226]